MKARSEPARTSARCASSRATAAAAQAFTALTVSWRTLCRSTQSSLLSLMQTAALSASKRCAL
eukprot:6193501-Pleurochrysis_carterae.AAC.1